MSTLTLQQAIDDMLAQWNAGRDCPIFEWPRHVPRPPDLYKSLKEAGFTPLHRFIDLRDKSFFPVRRIFVMVLIVGDGGCRNNGNANPQAYGSYVALAHRQDRVVKRHESGIMSYPDLRTNHEAELQTVIEALRYLLGFHARVPYAVRYQTDSNHMARWLTNDMAINPASLTPLVRQAQALAARFESVTFEVVPRMTILDVLGH